MHCTVYKNIRKQVGTVTEVAGLLGVTQPTIYNRERGVSPIREEAAIALLALAKEKREKLTAQIEAVAS